MIFVIDKSNILGEVIGSMVVPKSLFFESLIVCLLPFIFIVIVFTPPTITAELIIFMLIFWIIALIASLLYVLCFKNPFKLVFYDGLYFICNDSNVYYRDALTYKKDQNFIILCRNERGVRFNIKIKTDSVNDKVFALLSQQVSHSNEEINHPLWTYSKNLKFQNLSLFLFCVNIFSTLCIMKYFWYRYLSFGNDIPGYLVVFVIMAVLFGVNLICHDKRNGKLLTLYHDFGFRIGSVLHSYSSIKNIEVSNTYIKIIYSDGCNDEVLYTKLNFSVIKRLYDQSEIKNNLWQYKPMTDYKSKVQHILKDFL